MEVLQSKFLWFVRRVFNTKLEGFLCHTECSSVYSRLASIDVQFRRISTRRVVYERETFVDDSQVCIHVMENPDAARKITMPEITLSHEPFCI